MLFPSEIESLLKKSPYNISFAYWLRDYCPVSANSSELTLFGKYLEGMSENNPEWWKIAKDSFGRKDFVRLKNNHEKKITENGQTYAVPGLDDIEEDENV